MMAINKEKLLLNAPKERYEQQYLCKVIRLNYD